MVRGSLARLLAAAALLAPLPAFAERQCEIPGDKIHWIADYCMAQLETDDEIPASECISKEDAVPFPSDCAAKRHYKKAMCELSVSRGTITHSVERCVADKEYIGATVRNGGVGGRR